MKLLAAFPLVFLLAQASSSGTANQNLETSGKEIVNNGLNLILAALNYTIDYVQDFDEKYAANSTEVDLEEVEELLERGNQVFNLTVAILNKVLDAMESQLGETGKKTAECIRKEEETARKAMEKILTDYGQCINVHIPQIIASYQDALKALIETRDILSSAQIKLEECKLADLCLVELVKNLDGLSASLQSIVEAAPPVVKILKEIFLEDTPTCIKNDSSNILGEIVGILEDLGKCIKA